MSTLSGLAGSKFSAIPAANFNATSMLDISSKFPNSLSSWTALANLPEATFYNDVNIIGNTIYSFSGQDAISSLQLSTSYKYNILTDTWTSIQNQPTVNYGYANGATSVVGSNIYHMMGLGGGVARTETWKYDTLADTWTQLANSPIGLNYIALSSIGTDIYSFGGSETLGARSNTLYKYNTLSNVWSTISPIGTLPEVRWLSSMVSVGSILYMTGGSGNSTPADLADCWKYDTIANTWTRLADMPVIRRGHSMVTNGTDIWVLNGIGNITIYDKSIVYNIASNSWSNSFNYPEKVVSPQGSVMNGNKIYTVGGDPNSATGPIKNVNVLDINYIQQKIVLSK